MDRMEAVEGGTGDLATGREPTTARMGRAMEELLLVVTTRDQIGFQGALPSRRLRRFAGGVASRVTSRPTVRVSSPKVARRELFVKLFSMEWSYI